MPKDLKNVFISHIHEDDAGLTDLKNLVKENGMEMRDSSITKDKPNNAKDPNYIKDEYLKPGIDWAGTLIVYISPDTKNSDWVNWEIEYANETNTRIVGVYEQGAKDCELPVALEKYADAIVGWHGDSIVRAINGENNWEKPDGTKRDNIFINRHPC